MPRVKRKQLFLVCLNIYRLLFMFKCLDMYIYIYIHIHTYTHKHICHIYVYMYTYTYHIYAQIPHIHTNMWVYIAIYKHKNEIIYRILNTFLAIYIYVHIKYHIRFFSMSDHMDLIRSFFLMTAVFNWRNCFISLLRTLEISTSEPCCTAD